MARRIRDAYRRSWFGKPTGLTNGMTMAVTVVLAVFALFIPYSFWRDAVQEAAGVRADREIDAYNQCVRRAESRTEIRGMFLATFDVIEVSSPESTATLDTVRVRLDERYPALDPNDCPTP